MLLAVDIGNSDTKFGIYDDETLLSKFSIPTNLNLSPADLSRAIGDNANGQISEAIICSVVPQAEAFLAELLRSELCIEPILVRNDFDFNVRIDYEPLASVGTDRLVNSAAAAQIYGVPCIVCSFGTATTIDVVNADRVFVGGIIAPGVKLMSEALHLNTAQLPEIEIRKPEKVVGNTTADSIRSGVFHGHLGMVENLLARIRNEIGYDAKVIATGGFASLIAENTNEIDLVDENLTLEGLRLLFYKDPAAE